MQVYLQKLIFFNYGNNCFQNKLQYLGSPLKTKTIIRQYSEQMQYIMDIIPYIDFCNDLQYCLPNQPDA